MIHYLIECSPKTKEYTLAFEINQQKHYVLSKYEPKKSALKVLDKVDLGNKSTVWFIFGFQFGYVINHLLEVVGEDVNILVIEPDEKLLNEALELCDNYQDKLHIHFFSGENFALLKRQIDFLIGDDNFNNFRIITNEKYIVYYKDYYKQIVEIINQRVEDKVTNYYTVILNGTQNIINTVRNRHEMAKTCDLRKLEDKYKGVPAVIVSAGPSLDKNIHYLKEFNGIVIVMGRTITPVMNVGVTPDFLVSVDPNDYNHDAFGDYQKFDVPLVTLGQCTHRVVEGCQSPYKYFLYNGNEVKGLLNIRVNPVLSLSGSVATLCLSTAYHLGCSPILFIGQDLAFEGKKRYAQGANKADKAADVDKAWGLRKIKGYYGDEVYSEAQMIGFLRWIEDFIDTNKNSEYINCTEGGAYIEGAKHMPFKEAIACYNPSEKITIQHEFLDINKGIDVDENFMIAVESIRTIKKCVHIGAEHYGELIKLFTEDKHAKKHNKKVLRHLKEIEKADLTIKEVERSEFIMKVLLERIEYAIKSSNDSKEALHETKEERKVRQLRLNRETYIYLERECEGLLDLLNKEIVEVETLLKNNHLRSEEEMTMKRKADKIGD